MRGKEAYFGNSIVGIRITPAYAGKSASRRKYVSAVRDHPRLCGEKLSHLLWQPTSLGSPPPMRGKAKAKSCEKTDAGITPAYAGKK